MANINSGDSIKKTVESASVAVENAAAVSSMSDKPDAKFSDLAEKPVEQVNDITRNEPAGSAELKDADSDSRRSKTLTGGAILTLLSSLEKTSSLKDYKNEDEHRELLEEKFGWRRHYMECLIGTLADALEFKKESQEFGDLINETNASHGAFGAPCFIALGGQSTNSGIECVASINTMAIAKVPLHYAPDVEFGIRFGEYIGFWAPFVGSYAVLWATCTLFRSGTFSKIQKFAYSTKNSALRHYLGLRR
jgi:hypothetical protein